jgi:pyruvate/2-oxoglutarate dehydrogenase complex dihydrolipoamide dehydrogenase (E3) component
VVIATGSRATRDARSKWHPFPIAGADAPWVLDHEAALVDLERCGHRVIVLDAVGHIEGLGLGELLAASGRDVTVLCPLPTPMLLDPETMARALPRMVRAGAHWRPNTVLAGIGDHDVTVVDTLARELETITGVDTVVIRTHGEAVDHLYHELAGLDLAVHRVGDAVAARWIDRAVMDGHLVGRAL